MEIILPRELNFIKTTLKSSLDSQISLLPLGFSLQMSASKKSGGNSSFCLAAEPTCLTFWILVSKGSAGNGKCKEINVMRSIYAVIGNGKLEICLFSHDRIPHIEDSLSFSFYLKPLHNHYIIDDRT